MGWILENIHSEAISKQHDPQRQYPTTLASPWPPTASNVNVQHPDYGDATAPALFSIVRCPSPSTQAIADQIDPSGHHSTNPADHGHNANEEKTDHVSKSTTPVSDTTEGTSTSSEVEMGDCNQPHIDHLEVVLEDPKAVTAS